MEEFSENEIDQLVAEAKKARKNAYAPYSNFHVGAALLLKNSSIIHGNNVENSSYGLSICAERVAIAAAIAQGHHEFALMAVVTDTSPPAAPCGACRQVMSEFAPDLPLILANTDGQVIKTTLSAIFPLQFSKEQLNHRLKE